MNNQININELVTIEQGQTVTTSLKIASLFKKQHKNVLQKIEALQCSSEFVRHNFKPILYLDNYNRNQKAYEISKDGFSILVMSFTGKRAMQFKEQYISQFNKMNEIIQGLQANQSLLSNQSNRVKIIDAPTPESYTVTAWERITKAHLSNRMRKIIGKEASKICREQGYTIERVPSQRWGFINAYPRFVLEQLFNQPKQYIH